MRRLHAVAGVTAFVLIAGFWTATVLSELFGSAAQVASVKQAILWCLLLLVPTLAATGASGFRMGRGRSDAGVARKRRRMPLIAANGLLVLVPCAVFLADRAADGVFDAAFIVVQSVELVAGAANLVLIGLNIRDGLTAAGRRVGYTVA